ncbi:MAG: LptA/OstA family protein, partial [Blastocatellia bacterium]
SGHVIYSGHARLWEGQSVLDADRIEIWRDEKKVQASGNVLAVFPQASGVLPMSDGSQAGLAGKATSVQRNGTDSGQPKGPTLWHIRAPVLTYWDVPGKAHLEGGVVASSDQGSLRSQTLDVYLLAAPASSVGSAKQSSKQSNRPGSRQVNRAVALGGVVVTQGDRRGSAEQAEYTAAEGKFVLSGGKPTITDASRDTTTGHSLTFFVANDTILIDSQEGSRTLTKHRVEK